MKHLTITMITLVAMGCGGSAVPPPLETIAPLDEAKADEAKAPEPPAPAPDPGWANLPKPSAPKVWAPAPIVTWTMQNGITVWYVLQEQVPLVSVELLLPRGSSSEPAEKAGLTSLTADMLDEGAARRSSLAIGDELQRLATSYEASSGTDSVSVSMSMLSDKVEASLAILADIVLRPDLPPAEFERRKAQRIASLLQEEADPSYGRSMVMRKVLFGEGYAGSPPDGTRPTIEKLGLDDIKARYLALFVPQGAHFIVVGAVSEQDIKAKLEAQFGKWRGTTDVRPLAVAERDIDNAVYFVDYPESAQSSLALCRPEAGGRHAPDYFEAEVLNRVLGGAFTSRLNLNLREDKGYTYGAKSAFHRYRHAGFLLLAAKVKTETTRQSIDEMILEIEAVGGKKPLTKVEHQNAVDGMLLGYPAEFEQISGTAARVAELPTYDLPKDWFLEWPKRVSGVTLEAANQVGVSIGKRQDYIIIVAGDREKVAPTLESLGRPIRYFNAQGQPVQSE